MPSRDEVASLLEMHEGLVAADNLHSAVLHLAREFSVKMTRDEAQANVDARTMLINCQNFIMDSLYNLDGLSEAGGLVQLRVVRRIKR